MKRRASRECPVRRLNRATQFLADDAIIGVAQRQSR
jgi:hypothetical protein